VTLAPGGLFAEATTAEAGTFEGGGAELGARVALAPDKTLVNPMTKNETVTSLLIEPESIDVRTRPKSLRKLSRCQY
jgi:hypothetical protein